jgi:hypothetical protein
MFSSLCDKKFKCKTEYWFRCHRHSVGVGEVDGVALLSSLLPEERIDRVCVLSGGATMQGDSKLSASK